MDERGWERGTCGIKEAKGSNKVRHRTEAELRLKSEKDGVVRYGFRKQDNTSMTVQRGEFKGGDQDGRWC